MSTEEHLPNLYNGMVI